MVWIKWADYGKKTKIEKRKSVKRKKPKPKRQPLIKVIPGKHKVEFKKASELNRQ